MIYLPFHILKPMIPDLLKHFPREVVIRTWVITFCSSHAPRGRVLAKSFGTSSASPGKLGVGAVGVGDQDCISLVFHDFVWENEMLGNLQNLLYSVCVIYLISFALFTPLFLCWSMQTGWPANDHDRNNMVMKWNWSHQVAITFA